MQTSLTTTRPSSHLLTALVGFIVLFAAITAGYTLVNAGRTKWQDPVWTGNRAGVAISGFLKGADQKAVRTDRNPYPDVLPPVHTVNDLLFASHAPLVAWLVTLGEMLLPVSVVILLCMKFPGSRIVALILTALATSLHFLYMLEGSSGMNPLLVFMWLTVLWVLATMPDAALFFAFDLRRLAGGRNSDHSYAIESAADRWVFFLGILVLTAGGGGMLYAPQTFLGLLGATLLTVIVLYALKPRSMRQPVHAGRTIAPAGAERSRA